MNNFELHELILHCEPLFLYLIFPWCNASFLNESRLLGTSC